MPPLATPDPSSPFNCPIAGASGATHVGKVRTLNEDSYFLGSRVFVVADGMGGHEAGEVASQLVVARLAMLDSAEVSAVELEQAVHESNRDVRLEGVRRGVGSMGTTLVGAAVVRNGPARSLLIFNVGDSRCYLWTERDGLRQVTKDHSLVQELIDEGRLDQSGAATHPHRNVVTRAIGVEDAVVVDFVAIPHDTEGRLLLCSDGVSGELSDDRLAALLGERRDPAHTADELISAVLAQSARDNATVLVIDLKPCERDSGVDKLDDDVTGPRPLPPPNPQLIATVPAPTVSPPESIEPDGVTTLIEDVPG